MNFYELVFIIRQDVVSTDVDKIINDLKAIIVSSGEQRILKEEYWGLRNLAYEIRGNRRGHYVMLAMEGLIDTISELQRRIQLNENIIRFMFINVDKINKDEPSPILKNKSLGSDNSVDVTTSKENV